MNQIIKTLLCAILLFSISPIHNDDFAYADNVQNDLFVNASVINLREGPGLSYPILKELKQNEQMKKVQQNGDWIQVEVDGKTGWVALWLTKTIQSKETTKTSSKAIVISQVDYLNVRLDATVSSSVLTQLSVGQEATYLKETDEWIQIEVNGKIGWVSKKYVSLTKASAESNSTKKKSSQTASEANVFTVNVAAVNIRKKPNLNAKKLGTIKNGEQYDVLSHSGNWVQIQYKKGKKGWVYSFYGTFSQAKKSTATKTNDRLTILYDGTNLREQPNTGSNVLYRANPGETFEIVESENNWYKIRIADDQYAYVANWVVSTDKASKTSTATKKKQETRKKGTLNGLTIVIDPGHGGNDHGTTGVTGTPEKSVNLETAELLTDKLRAAGANVVLTRESDKYIDLRTRVYISHKEDADAYISIHYDASEMSSVNGFTTYYATSNQKELAEYVHKGVGSKVTLKDRGVQPGNYFVIRENKQPAILLELGYLSNSTEERTINTDYYREQATQGIYKGLIAYFDNKLK